MAIKSMDALPEGQFATAVKARLEEKGWSILHLAKELDITYEHVRRIVHGLAFPSKRFLRDLCEVLQLNFPQMEKFVVSDKIQRRFGTIPLELAGKNPRFVTLERILPHLTDEQFESLPAMAQHMDRRNRELRKV